MSDLCVGLNAKHVICCYVVFAKLVTHLIKLSDEDLKVYQSFECVDRRYCSSWEWW
jgi:hypothetical protein